MEDGRMIRFLMALTLAMAVAGCVTREWVADTNTNCSLCKGAGRYQCPTCNGTCFTGSCNPCGGQGRGICNACNGTGNTQNKGKLQTCSYCNGTGRAACSVCGGNGRQPCPKCSAKGIVECGKWVEVKKDK